MKTGLNNDLKVRDLALAHYIMVRYITEQYGTFKHFHLKHLLLCKSWEEIWTVFYYTMSMQFKFQTYLQLDM